MNDPPQNWGRERGHVAFSVGKPRSRRPAGAGTGEIGAQRLLAVNLDGALVTTRVWFSQ